LVLGGILLAGCGRLGFESQSRSELADAAPPDVSVSGVPFDPMTLVGCSQAAPFLHFIDVIQVGNVSTQYARYCYAGLVGPLVATVRYAVDGDVYVGATVDIAAEVVSLQFGSSGCIECFVRLEANGLLDDGPVTNFAGD
jgi:hypothetical protein